MQVKKFLFALSISGEGSKKIIHRKPMLGGDDDATIAKWRNAIPLWQRSPYLFVSLQITQLKKKKNLRYINPHLGTTSLYQII
jgi:hypothetical protein